MKKSKLYLRKKLKKYVCIALQFDQKGSRIISNLNDPYK